MNETYVTIVGNALHNPEWRKTTTTGAMVTSFRIASTARRLDRDSGRWIDGNSLRVRVTCWRKLAENVNNSVTSGDPLIVTGRLFTRDWEDEKGAKRTAYELEATSVGHDLSRGRAVFERVRPQTSTSAVEDAEAEQRIGGESTEPVSDAEAPTQFNDMSYQAALDGGLPAPAPVAQSPVPAPAGHPDDPTGVLRRAGFTADPLSSPAAGADEFTDELTDDLTAPHDDLALVGEPDPEPHSEPAPEPDPEPSSEADPQLGPEPRTGRRRGPRRSGS